MKIPDPFTRLDIPELKVLIGAELAAVTYHYLPLHDGAAYAGSGSGMDVDLAAVELVLSNRGHLTITWAMRGEWEGLALFEDSYSGVVAQPTDASDLNAWRPHRREAIRSVGAAWQHFDGIFPETMWAIRLNFSVSSVVIALGTDDPALDYLPDELLVIHHPMLAHSYKPPHVRGSSWGKLVATGAEKR